MTITITELTQRDLPFLMELWSIPEVMKYADEFPGLRGWKRNDEIKAAWNKYVDQRESLGVEYTQLILWLDNEKRIGESFFTKLEEGYTFGRWRKPNGVACVMGDIKLIPRFWGQGFGTAGMRQVVQWVFTKTGCQLFVVPPHRHNPAAERVYEKAGFRLFPGMRSWRNHKIMELERETFIEIYGRE